MDRAGPLTLVLASEGAHLAEAMAALRLHLPRTQTAVKRQIEEGVRKGQLERSQAEWLQVYLDSVLTGSLVVLGAEQAHSPASALYASLKRAVVQVKVRTLTVLRLEAKGIGHQRKVRNLACKWLGRGWKLAITRTQAEAFSTLRTAKTCKWRQGIRTAEMVMRNCKAVTELLAFRRWKLNVRSRPQPLCKALERIWRSRFIPIFSLRKTQECRKKRRQERIRVLLRNKIAGLSHCLQLKLQKWRMRTSNGHSAIRKLMALAVFKPKEVLKTWRLAAARNSASLQQRKACKLNSLLSKVATSHLRRKPLASPQLLRMRLDTAMKRSVLEAFRRVLDRSKVRSKLRALALCALHRPRAALCKWQRQTKALEIARILKSHKGRILIGLLQPLATFRTKFAFQTLIRTDSVRGAFRTLAVLSQSSLRKALSKWRFAAAEQEAGKTHRQLQGWKASSHLEKAVRPALRSAFKRRPVSHSLSLQQTLTRLSTKSMRKSWDIIAGRGAIRVKPVLLKLAARPKSAFQIWKKATIPRKDGLRVVVFRNILLKAVDRTVRPITLRLVRPRGTITRSFRGLIRRWGDRVKDSMRKLHENTIKSKQQLLNTQKQCTDLARIKGTGVKAGCRRLARLFGGPARRAVTKWQKVTQSTKKINVSGLKFMRRLERAQRRIVRSTLLWVIKGKVTAVSSLLRVMQLHFREPKSAVCTWRRNSGGRVKCELKLLLRGQLLRGRLISVVLRPLRSASHMILGSWWTVVWSRMAKRTLSAFIHWRTTTLRPSEISLKPLQLVLQPAGRIIDSQELAAKKLNKALHSLPKRLVRAVFAQVVTGERHARVRVAEVLRIMRRPTFEAFQKWGKCTHNQAKTQLLGEIKAHQLRKRLASIPIAMCNFAFHVLVDPPNRVKTALRALIRSGKDSMQGAIHTWQRYTVSVKAGKLLSAITIHRIQYLLDHVPTRLVNGVFKTVTAKPQKTKSALRAIASGLLHRSKRCWFAWKAASSGTTRMALRREVLRRGLSHSLVRTLRDVFSSLTGKTGCGLENVRKRVLARVLGKMPNPAFAKWKFALQRAKEKVTRFNRQGEKLKELLGFHVNKRLHETFGLLTRNTKAGVRKVARLFARRIQAALALWRSKKPACKGKRLVAGLWSLVLRRARLTFDYLKSPSALKRALRSLGVLSGRGQQAALTRWKKWVLLGPAVGLKLQRRIMRVSTPRLRCTLQRLSFPKQVRKALRTILITAAKSQRRTLQLWQKTAHPTPTHRLLPLQHIQQLPIKVLRSCWNQLFGSPHTLHHLRVLSRLLKGTMSSACTRWKGLVQEHLHRTRSRRATLFTLKLKSASARRMGSALASVTVQNKSTWILLQNVLKWHGQTRETRIRGLQWLVLGAAARTLLSVLRRIRRGGRSSSMTPSRQSRRNHPENNYILLRIRAIVYGRMQFAMAALEQRTDTWKLVRKVQAAHKTAGLLQRGKGVSVRCCFQIWKSDWHLSRLQEKALLRLVFGVSASYQSAFWKWKLLVRRRHKPSPAALIQRLRSHASQQELRAADQADALGVLGLVLRLVRVRQLTRALGRIQALT